MATTFDIIIIGGGLAGLTGAIHLSKEGFKVLVMEQNAYPKHKVCGEYISNEVLPYLKWLELDITALSPSYIEKVAISNASGKTVSGKLPLGGFGISRYTFDNYLMMKAVENGCTIIKDKATEVEFTNDVFEVYTASNDTYRSKVTMGAYGKRAALDQKIRKHFFQRKSPWLAVKAHYKGHFPNDVVELHNFKGGYCGVSKVENDVINICYLADYKSFKRYGSIPGYQEAVLYKNKALKNILSNSEMIFEQPLTISQIDFKKKDCVHNHILMVGDTAGLIYPLCGNGMAMAIQSAQIASGLIVDYFHDKITRREMEKLYVKKWKKAFTKRLRAGKFFSSLFQNVFITEVLRNIIHLFPFLLPTFIKQTHGKPINTAP